MTKTQQKKQRPKRYIVLKNAQHGQQKIREPWQVIDTTTNGIVDEYSSGRMARGAAAHYNRNGKPANFRYGLKPDDPLLRTGFLIMHPNGYNPGGKKPGTNSQAEQSPKPENPSDGPAAPPAR
jgi:hypothetical protein